MASLKKILKKKKYSEIKLKQIKTNHLEVVVKVNGVKGNFILDTGASSSCIGIHLKNHFNLTSEETDLKAAGAGALGMETQKSSNNNIKIGSWKTLDCDLVLFDLSHVNEALKQQDASEVQGIIGADILGAGKAIIDYNKRNLFLKKVKNKKVIALPF